MPTPSIPYPLKVYDIEAWERLIKKATANGNSINMELNVAIANHAPDPNKKKPKKK